MNVRVSLIPTILASLLVLLLAGSAAAQVATLATPDPDATTTPAPVEEVDGEQALLEFVACLNEHGLDLPDPQFGPEGPRFADPSVFMSIDFRSAEFLDAMEACQGYLEAMQPEVDPELQAEQNEQLLVFAECMRGEGIDFPDPDPVRGLTIGSMRGPDGELVIDPFSPEFRSASATCSAAMGLEEPAGPRTP